jgi:D-threo-aldose 1-dehydrogenase
LEEYLLSTRREFLRTAAIGSAALSATAVPPRAASASGSEQQILADYTSMQTKIPADFWTDLKAQKLIEQNAPKPA